MRRIFLALSLSLTVLATFASAVSADPATELPAQACNQGTALALGISSANSNVPVPPHGNHGCHVHLPQ